MENMKKLLEEMEKNPKLKAKIEELDQNKDSVPKDYIQAAAEYGIELTEEDVQPKSGQGEISDDELDAVAGGDACVCVLGGGGSAGYYEKTCACVLGGGGEYGNNSQLKGYARCYCVAGGVGEDGNC